MNYGQFSDMLGLVSGFYLDLMLNFLYGMLYVIKSAK